MELEEFRQYVLQEDIRETAIKSHCYPEDVFIDYCIDILQNDFSLIHEMNHSFFENKEGNRKCKRMRLDASYYDQETSTLQLLIVDYNEGEIKNITNTTIENLCKLLLAYFENALNGCFNEYEPSDPAVQLATDIIKNIDNIETLHLFIISTDKLSKSVKTLKLDDFKFGSRRFKVLLDVLDIEKIYRSKSIDFKKESIVIKCNDFGIDGIPCIKADIDTDQYDSYLAIVPGQFLSDIYQKYGMKLLESNVRSFLKFNGKINKGIRNTIIKEKSRFFTYNNGISTTAKHVRTENTSKGLFITEFTDMQIINGGQTTAALAATNKKSKEDLSGIFVQMKLTVLKSDDPELICNIARFANSQNKVNTADLNSSHPFYVRMEDFSRKIYTPLVSGELNQQLWFFERIRGQYEQPLLLMEKKKDRDKYKLIRPKTKKFTLTDLAKYMNAADLYPHYVSWGGEVNASFFHSNMTTLWEKENDSFNELFYKELIGKKLFFSFIENTISEQSWYQEKRAYRPQLVAYTFSKIVYEAKRLNKDLNYKEMWDKQCVPHVFCADVAAVAKLVFNVMYDEKRSTANIESYCKKEDCWSIIKKTEYDLTENVKEILILKPERDVELIHAQKEYQLDASKYDKNVIFEKGSIYWKCLLEKGLQQGCISGEEEKNLIVAADYCDQLVLDLSHNQIEAIYAIEKKLKENEMEMLCKSEELLQ